MLHHTLGDGRLASSLCLVFIIDCHRFDAYLKASENFTISQASLFDPSTAAVEIDRVLTDCITRARPVYLTLPTDLVFHKISSERLKIPLPRVPPPNDPEVEAFVLDEIVKLVEAAEDDVVILVDACAIRHDVRAEVNELIVKTGFPVYSAPMGKTVVSENYERYGGVCFYGSLYLFGP
jgi:pyruvate decarboxylase